jgi:hypothetical protein
MSRPSRRFLRPRPWPRTGASTTTPTDPSRRSDTGHEGLLGGSRLNSRMTGSSSGGQISFLVPESGSGHGHSCTETHTRPAEFARNVRTGLRPQDMDRLEREREEREKQQRRARIRAHREFAGLSALEELGDGLVKPCEPLLIPPRLHNVDTLSLARRLRGDVRPLSPKARALLTRAPQAGSRSAASNLAASADTRANGCGRGVLGGRAGGDRSRGSRRSVMSWPSSGLAWCYPGMT